MKYKSEVFTDRNKYIMSLFNEGYTCRYIGDKFNISHQRVHQIVVHTLGRKTGRRDRMHEEVKERRIKRDNTIKFKCKYCGKDVTYKNAGAKSTFCSRICFNRYFYRDRKIFLKCSNCGKEYHPYRNYKSNNSLEHFCSMGCYTLFLGKNKKPKIHKTYMGGYFTRIISLRKGGLKYREIAEKLNVPVGTVNWSIGGARKEGLI